MEGSNRTGDPLLRAFAAAPIDDEPLTETERRAIEAAYEDMEAGGTSTLAEVVARLGEEAEVVAKELRIDDPGLVQKARESTVIIIGDRSFVALDTVMTIQEESGWYEPDEVEVEMLRQAAADTRPKLRGTEVDDYLARRLKELGRD